jgi:hypothetical protein
MAALCFVGGKVVTTGDLARDLAPFVGAVLPDRSIPGVLFVVPPEHGALYGGLRPWANVVREYVRGRRFPASIAVGFDPPYAAAIAASRVGVAVLSSTNQERERALQVSLRDLGLGLRARTVLAEAGVRTLGALLALDDLDFIAHAGSDALALSRRFPRGEQLGIPFTSSRMARV